MDDALVLWRCKVEGVHPMDSGIFRRKYRRDRRAGMPREHPVVFYARYGWEIVSKHLRYVWLYLMFHSGLSAGGGWGEARGG